MKNKKKISIVTPAFNEENNIKELINRIENVTKLLEWKYDFEHIVIDNASTDKTFLIAKEIAKTNKKIKLILNNRNFGPVRSPFHGLISANGDAVILIASDLQDPPELIPELLLKWEDGWEAVMTSKLTSIESLTMKAIRKYFYRGLNLISEVPLENDATGSGLYDKKIIDLLRKINDPYPYFRGLVCELGFKRTIVKYNQPQRYKDKSKASIYGMLDQALMGITKHSKVPLRIMTILGIAMGLVSLLLALIFLALKILYWETYPIGIASLLICFSFFASIQFFFLGLIGEYLSATLTHVRNMPHVIERERINFDEF